MGEHQPQSINGTRKRSTPGFAQVSPQYAVVDFWGWNQGFSTDQGTDLPDRALSRFSVRPMVHWKVRSPQGHQLVVTLPTLPYPSRVLLHRTTVSSLHRKAPPPSIAKTNDRMDVSRVWRAKAIIVPSRYAASPVCHKDMTQVVTRNSAWDSLDAAWLASQDIRITAPIGLFKIESSTG